MKNHRSGACSSANLKVQAQSNTTNQETCNCKRLQENKMNFTAQIKRGVTALVLCSALGLVALTHAASASSPSNSTVVAPTRISVVVKATGASIEPSALTTTRVHVGKPVMVSVNPTPRQIARAAR
jgi:hypothetical protein